MEYLVEARDVIVIGGGPAGSTAAGFLAKESRDVLLLEKERFPRYHIGESLLSATLPILSALGVTERIRAAGFVEKPGGTFIWGARHEPWSFYFRDDPGGSEHAWHVLRSEFDEILLRHAAGLGADVREESIVTSVRHDGERSTVEWRSNGSAFAATARWIVDSSGQSALLGRRDSLRVFDPFFRNLAIFGYFRGARRLDGGVAGNILSAAFRDGWFWFIPLHDGTTSVGAVVDVKRFADESARHAGALYRRLVDACDEVRERLDGAELVSPVRVIRDYSYASSSFHGPGYLLAGDAACFIDPVFSTGVHLACLAGFLASGAIDTLLAGGDEKAVLEEYDARYRAAFERYREFLYFFYDHHRDADSYFWTARKILNPESGLDPRRAFVHLISGGADLDGLLTRHHERMERATGADRFGAAPGAGIFRARTTVETLRRPWEKPRSE